MGHARMNELSQQVPDEFYFEVNIALSTPFGVRWVVDHFELEGPFVGKIPKPKPSAADWQKFWVSVEKIGVWDWNPSYENLLVLDGEDWELSVRYQGKVVRSKGSNAYPSAPGEDSNPSVSYIRFIKALGILTGISRSFLTISE